MGELALILYVLQLLMFGEVGKLQRLVASAQPFARRRASVPNFFRPIGFHKTPKRRNHRLQATG